MYKRKHFVSNVVMVALLWAFSFCLTAGALDIDITYGPSAPILGFHHESLGSQRQAAFQKAVDIWETHLQGTIPLKIDARFVIFPVQDPPLAASQYTSANANLSGLPLSGTWYPNPVGSQLRGISMLPSAGPFPGLHMVIAIEDTFNTGPVGSGIFYYGLDGNPPAGDIDFVSVMLHELAHALGFAPLIDLATGEWANVLNFEDPPPVLPFGDIFSRQLTRTPNPPGGANDIDFWDMTAFGRFVALSSDEVYWKGPAVKAAAEFTPPPPMGLPEINSKGEVQMYATAQVSGSSLSHWDGSHINNVMMKANFFNAPPFADIDATKEAMIDIGWLVNTPPAAGPVAWVDFGFVGEEFGSEILPFNTFGAAVTFVTAGGVVNIKAGSSTETPTVSKAMTVNAVGGSASIGVSPRSTERANNQQNTSGFVSRQSP